MESSFTRSNGADPVRDAEGASEALDGLRTYAVVAAHTIRQRAEIENMVERLRAALRDAAPAPDEERERAHWSKWLWDLAQEHEAAGTLISLHPRKAEKLAAMLRADAGRQRGSE
jgi:hypothetical protein